MPRITGGEIHDDVDRLTERHVHGVEPPRIGYWPVVFQVREEVRLVYVQRMDFTRAVHDLPMLKLSGATTGRISTLAGVELS